MEITTQRRADLVSDAWLKGCDGVWGSLGALGTPEEVRRSRSPPGKMAQHSWASAPRRPGFPWCGWAACHTEQRGWDAAPGMRGAGDSLHLGDQGDAAPEAGRVAGGSTQRLGCAAPGGELEQQNQKSTEHGQSRPLRSDTGPISISWFFPVFSASGMLSFYTQGEKTS